MAERESMDCPNHDNGSGAAGDFAARAAQACAAGDMVLGMHLYLAAYEQEIGAAQPSEDTAVDILREAWHLACDLHERSIAEYVYEKIEPYLSGAEQRDFASRLQDLALDRLEEYGFSREELEGVAQMISDDLVSEGGSLLQIEQYTIPHVRRAGSGGAAEVERAQESTSDEDAAEESSALEAVADPSVEDAPAAAAAASASDGEAAVPNDADRSRPSSADARSLSGMAESHSGKLQQDQAKDPLRGDEPLTYRNLVGYDETIAVMRDFGVGMMDDPEFTRFVSILNQRHGLTCMPSLDSMLFRAVAREDATRFVEATIGELGLPALRVSMEENIQGMPILCVTAQADNQPKLNQARNRFTAPAVLVLEDLDLWSVPEMPENPEGISGFVMANITRGARAAFDLVRSAVDDPDVYVLATAQMGEEADPFFYELLEPLSVVDIGYPTEKERRDIWHDIARSHPSLRTISRRDLARYSAGMPRYDIYMAAREALEEAYKMGLMAREYVPVTPQNIFEKLAACQPLDSQEYLALEDEVIRDFRHDLDNLEDLLGDA